MRKFILSVILLTIFATLCGAQQTVNSNTSEVPFFLESGLIIVEAKIKGSVPVHVVLSTGMENSIVDFSMLDKHKLTAYYSSAGDGPTTGTSMDTTVSYAKVSGVSVGGSKSKELSMRFGALPQIGQATGREIFGALGADFFEGQIVQFDFKNKVLRFLDKAPAAPRKDKDAGPNTGSSIILRMAAKTDSPFKRTFQLPVVGDVTFNGKEAKLLLDTGRATSVAFSTSAAKKAGFTLPEEKGQPRADKVSSLRLDTYEMADVPVMLYAKGTSAEQSLSRYGVVAGTLFLQNFIATFDFRNKVVILERI